MLNLQETKVIKKEAEKILKYINLLTEIQRVWHVTTKVIPVIIGQLEPFHNNSENT
jgi:hypothetical protein